MLHAASMRYHSAFDFQQSTPIVKTTVQPRCHYCAALPSPEVLDKTELKFLEDFCNLLRTAHYRMLTQEEWETATEEEYTVSTAFSLTLLCICPARLAFQCTKTSPALADVN